MRLHAFCLISTILTLAPQRVNGWGQEGHRLVAAIAAKHLKPAAAARVKELLSEGETLESISSWADRVRPDRPETSTWHYINIPVTDARDGSLPEQWKKFCQAAGCVTGMVEELAGKLGNGKPGPCTEG